MATEDVAVSALFQWPVVFIGNNLIYPGCAQCYLISQKTSQQT